MEVIDIRRRRRASRALRRAQINCDRDRELSKVWSIYPWHYTARTYNYTLRESRRYAARAQNQTATSAECDWLTRGRLTLHFPNFGTNITIVLTVTSRCSRTRMIAWIRIFFSVFGSCLARFHLPMAWQGHAMLARAIQIELLLIRITFTCIAFV